MVTKEKNRKLADDVETASLNAKLTLDEVSSKLRLTLRQVQQEQKQQVILRWTIKLTTYKKRSLILAQKIRLIETELRTKAYLDDFDIVNFSFLDGEVLRSTSYGVYISQLIRFPRVSSHVDDFNTRNKVSTEKTSQTRI